LKHLAKIAVSKGCGRFEWNVLDWNEPAIQFYESIGARPQNSSALPTALSGFRLTHPADPMRCFSRFALGSTGVATQSSTIR